MQDEAYGRKIMELEYKIKKKIGVEIFLNLDSYSYNKYILTKIYGFSL